MNLPRGRIANCLRKALRIGGKKIRSCAARRPFVHPHRNQLLQHRMFGGSHQVNCASKAGQKTAAGRLLLPPFPEPGRGPGSPSAISRLQRPDFLPGRECGPGERPVRVQVCSWSSDPMEALRSGVCAAWGAALLWKPSSWNSMMGVCGHEWNLRRFEKSRGVESIRV
jgi:hypothetical protein